MKKEHELIKMIKDNYLPVGDISSSGFLPLGREPEFLSMMYYKGLICFSNMEDTIINTKTEVYLNG